MCTICKKIKTAIIAPTNMIHFCLNKKNENIASTPNIIKNRIEILISCLLQ